MNVVPRRTSARSPARARTTAAAAATIGSSACPLAARTGGAAPPWKATHRRGRPPHDGQSSATPLRPPPCSPARRIGDSCVLHDVPS
ncbi:formin-like protein 5 [Iris pallida]|uniref:Formin-like protein 5 n=1 Tax=Iris pallida TaxID=29817 RepID=A0AAX6HEG9_IRIPA|nr:formin-like protein 5 [Iris pallida]KAJ6848976.1 formin-like protein 5 [Iris pallida]